MDNINLALGDLRQSIDHLDHALMFLLAQRLRVIIKVGFIKRQQDLSLEYSLRRKQDLELICQQAVTRSIRPEFIDHLFEEFYQYSLDVIHSSSTNPILLNETLLSLEHLRSNLYNLDMALCYLLAERFALVLQVGQLKRQHGLPPLDLPRFQAVLADKLKLASSLGLDSHFIEKLFHLIHQEALQLETEVKNEWGNI